VALAHFAAPAVVAQLRYSATSANHSIVFQSN
jgi:hypothetical protein